MQTTHTPGPWHIAAAQDRTYPHAIESRDSSFDGFQLARCVNPADARLIASAPDLVAALQQIADGCERRLRKGHDEGDAASLDIARAAIAKATGA